MNNLLSASRPIAIGGDPPPQSGDADDGGDARRPGDKSPKSWHGSSPAFIGAADAPRAPVIGSMPVPSRLNSMLPPLTLPASVTDTTATVSLSVSLRTGGDKLPGDPGSLRASSLLSALAIGDDKKPDEGSLRALSLLESSEFKSHIIQQRRRFSSEDPPLPPPPPANVDDAFDDDVMAEPLDDDHIFGFEENDPLNHAP